MRKLILLFSVSTLLISCGRDKKNETQAEDIKTATKDQYSVIIDGVYEKDDSISVVYQKNNFFLYDKPIWLKVKGSTTIQRLIFNIPEGEAIENVSFCASTNKNQEHITIKNITIKNEGIVLDGSNNKYYEYFATDPSFTWDDKNSRFILNHNNKYPPSIVGKEKLFSILVK